ncbi:MAG: hyaluronidase [Phycisphaerales bacterium]|nr:hyaluronidase [Phycisphaerales bacterium]
MPLFKNRGAATCAIVTSTACLSLASASLGNLPGDSTLDSRVDVADLLHVLSNMYHTCPADGQACTTDFNQNGQTDIDDLLTVFAHWGQVDVGTSSSGDDSSGDGIQLVGPDPVLMDSIYYDKYSRVQERAEKGLQLDQGWRTRGYNTKHGIDVLPYCYGGGVDQSADNHYSAEDLELFEAWLDANIPYEYDGPVVLDMEGDWWPMMNTADQELMDEIMDFYIEGLEYAEAMRPNAKFGYWGFPKKRWTNLSYDGPDVTRLMKRSAAIFPETYEYNPGGDDSVRIQQHIETCIEMVEGKVPVYVQMCSRYQDQEIGGWRHVLSNEELIRDQARPALDARWTDADGKTHRIAGLGLWDAYIYVRGFHHDWWSLNDDEITELWDEIDEIHLSMYQDLNALINGELSESETTVDTDDAPKSDTPTGGSRMSLRSTSKPMKQVAVTQTSRRKSASKSAGGRAQKRSALIRK